MQVDRPETWQERVERGWNQLFQDIRNWTSGNRPQHQYNDQAPLVQNIIYSSDGTVRSNGRTISPKVISQGVKFNFVTISKIIILVALVTLTIMLITNPEETVARGQSFFQWLRSIA